MTVAFAPAYPRLCTAWSRYPFPAGRVNVIALRALQNRHILIWLSSAFSPHFGKNRFLKRRRCNKIRHLLGDGTYGAGVRFWCFVCPVRRFRIPFPPHAFLENPSRPRASGRFLLSAGWVKNSKKQKLCLTVPLRVELYL